MAQNVTVAGASYSDVPSVVLPKTGGGSAQFDDTTIASDAAAAADISFGKKAYVNGSLVTGTNQGGGGVDAGQVYQDGAGYLVLDDDSGGKYDPSDATATAADILSPKTAYISGGKVTGSIVTKSSSDLTASGATVTVPAGYYASQATKSVASGSASTPATSITADPSISVNSTTGLITATASATKSVAPTVSAGYVSSGTAGTITVSGSNTSQLSTQAGTTVTPTESEQTAVAAGKYTTGAVKVGAISSTYVGSGIDRNDSTDLTASNLTVTAPSGYYASNATKTLSDGNLLAENIKKDITIFGVTGSFEGSGGGLVYETGTWTPSEDVATGEISFLNTHSTAPVMAIVADNDTVTVADSNIGIVYGNWNALLGKPIQVGTSQRFASDCYSYTSTGTSFGGAYSNAASLPALAGWMTSSKLYPYTGSTSRYWKSGRTYKWLAVWAPTS